MLVASLTLHKGQGRGEQTGRSTTEPVAPPPATRHDHTDSHIPSQSLLLGEALAQVSVLMALMDLMAQCAIFKETKTHFTKKHVC